MADADLNIMLWPTVKYQQDHIMFGNLGDPDVYERTLRIKIWDKQPEMVWFQLSKIKWTASIHQLPEGNILHIVGGSRKFLSDDTNIKGTTWQQLKKEAMKPGYTVEKFTSDYKLLKKLIEMQKAQGNMNRLYP